MLDRLLGKKKLKETIKEYEKLLQETGTKLDGISKKLSTLMERFDKKEDKIRELNRSIYEKNSKIESLNCGIRVLDSWLPSVVGFDCDVRATLDNYGFAFTISPVSYAKIKFPKMRFIDSNYNEMGGRRRTEVSLTDNPVLNDIFRRELASLPSLSRDVKVYDREVYVYGNVSVIPKIVKAYEESLKKYGEIINGKSEDIKGNK